MTNAGGLSENAMRQPDGWLKMLVSSVDRDEDAEIGLTVLIGGVVISGLAVSGHKFLVDFGEAISSAIGGDETIESGFIEAAYKIYPQTSDENTEQEQDQAADDKLPVQFLHLKDVRFLYPESNANFNFQFPYWRIQLSDVQGWTLGNLAR